MGDKAQSPELLGRSALARALGVAGTTVDKWAMRGCPHRIESGRKLFDLGEVRAWREREVAPASTARASEATGTLSDARRRKALVDAELAEYELAEKKGELVPAKLAVDELTRRFSRVRTKLLALPTALAPVVIAAKDKVEAKEILTAAITEMLDELSAPIKFDDDEPTPAA